MKNDLKFKDITDEYAGRLMDLLRRGLIYKERTYGFEYEFISSRPLDKDDMKGVYSLLPDCGFSKEGAICTSPSGMYITIEPGGQIEYCSPPFKKGDNEGFHKILDTISATNRKIKEQLGIEYLSVGYIPGRGDAPMILEAARYENLHARMAVSGTRGREMMKGTASIHLHAQILDMDDMVPLYGKFIELSKSDAFKMSPDRRDIWNHTDPVRCGQPVKDITQVRGPEALIRELVGFAMHADDIGENVPFPKKEDHSFEAFLYHMTTMFTDIRLNMKGLTWELRTLDSLPVSVFEQKWKQFIEEIEGV